MVKYTFNFTNLFKFLKLNNITYRSLCNSVGISIHTLYRMKRFCYNVSIDVLIRICIFLKCNLNDICEFTFSEYPILSDLDPDDYVISSCLPVVGNL